MQYWLELTSNTAISVLPKNGSSTIRQIAKPLNKNLHDYKRRIFFYREPIDRLISAYFFFRRLKVEDVKYTVDVEQAVVSWENFVDFVLVNDDEHWLPQCKLISDYTETKHLSELSQTIYDLTDQIIVDQNISVKTNVDTDYRINELKEYYKGDYSWL